MKKTGKTYAEQTEGIYKSELDWRKSTGEFQRCAWPADQKGSHKTMDCFRWARKEKGMAPFPKAKEYQKLKVRAYDQEESEVDLYTTDDEEDSEDGSINESEVEDQECLEEDSDTEKDSDTEEEEPEEQVEKN